MMMMMMMPLLLMPLLLLVVVVVVVVVGLLRRGRHGRRGGRRGGRCQLCLASRGGARRARGGALVHSGRKVEPGKVFHLESTVMGVIHDEGDNIQLDQQTIRKYQTPIYVYP